MPTASRAFGDAPTIHLESRAKDNQYISFHACTPQMMHELYNGFTYQFTVPVNQESVHPAQKEYIDVLLQEGLLTQMRCRISIPAMKSRINQRMSLLIHKLVQLAAHQDRVFKCING